MPRSTGTNLNLPCVGLMGLFRVGVILEDDWLDSSVFESVPDFATPASPLAVPVLLLILYIFGVIQKMDPMNLLKPVLDKYSHPFPN